MAKENLVQKMGTLRDRLSSIPIKFGVPQYKSLIVRQRIKDNEYQDIEIKPYPKIISISPSSSRVSSASRRDASLQISQNDYKITGVSRKLYSLESFIGDNVLLLIIDAVLSDDRKSIIRGIVCERPMQVDDKGLLTWTFTTREKPDEFTFPLELNLPDYTPNYPSATDELYT